MTVPSENGRRFSELPSALERFDDILDGLAGREPVFFLDYDGTLTPIVERPEDAILSDEMRGVVARLAERYPVAMISGRDVRFVMEQVAVDGVLYAGSHGFDIVGPPGVALEADTLAAFEGFLPALDRAEAGLLSALAEVEGARVERKKYSVAAHYRQVPGERVREVTAAVEQVLAEEPDLRRGTGKKVIEVRPDIDWDKGRAVLWLMETLGLEADTTMPFYLGDDVTDEDVFRVLSRLGIGIAVGPKERDTYAKFSLARPAEVGVFLSRMADTRDGRA